MIPFGEICKTRSGGTPSRANPEFYGGDIPWVKCGDLRDSIITKFARLSNIKSVMVQSQKALVDCHRQIMSHAFCGGGIDLMV